MAHTREMIIHLKGEPSPFHTRLMGMGIFQGTKVQLIKDDPVNQLLVIGIGYKRIVLRKAELINIELRPAHV